MTNTTHLEWLARENRVDFLAQCLVLNTTMNETEISRYRSYLLSCETTVWISASFPWIWDPKEKIIIQKGNTSIDLSLKNTSGSLSCFWKCTLINQLGGIIKPVVIIAQRIPTREGQASPGKQQAQVSWSNTIVNIFISLWTGRGNTIHKKRSTGNEVVMYHICVCWGVGSR